LLPNHQIITDRKDETVKNTGRKMTDRFTTNKMSEHENKCNIFSVGDLTWFWNKRSLLLAAYSIHNLFSGVAELKSCLWRHFVNTVICPLASMIL